MYMIYDIVYVRMCGKQVLVGRGVMVGQGSAPEGVANEHSWSNSPPHHDDHDNYHLGLLCGGHIFASSFQWFKLGNIDFEVDDGK